MLAIITRQISHGLVVNWCQLLWLVNLIVISLPLFDLTVVLLWIFILTLILYLSKILFYILKSLLLRSAVHIWGLGLLLHTFATTPYKWFALVKLLWLRWERNLLVFVFKADDWNIRLGDQLRVIIGKQRLFSSIKDVVLHIWIVNNWRIYWAKLFGL